MSNAYVYALDDSGRQMPNVIIAARWYGLAPSSYVYGYTDASGRASFTSNYVWSNGTFGFAVVNLLKVGLTYDPSRNAITSQTISFMKPE